MYENFLMTNISRTTVLVVVKLLQWCFYFHTEAIIGFDPDANNATEGTDLFVDLNVEVISGQLGRDVIVLFNTMDGFAIS